MTLIDTELTQEIVREEARDGTWERLTKPNRKVASDTRQA